MIRDTPGARALIVSGPAGTATTHRHAGEARPAPVGPVGLAAYAAILIVIVAAAVASLAPAPLAVEDPWSANLHIQVAPLIPELR